MKSLTPLRFLALTALATLLVATATSRAQNLYIADESNDALYEVNATTGATIAGFTSPSGLSSTSPNGLSYPYGVAVSGNNLYVGNTGTGKVDDYNATTGAVIAGFTSPSGMELPTFIAVSAVPEPGTWASGIAALAGLLLVASARRMRTTSVNQEVCN